MEQLLNTHDGLPALLASICVIMALHLIFKVGEFAWQIVKKKNELSDKSIEKLTAALEINTRAVHGLEKGLRDLQIDMAELPKFKTDLRRAFQAVKIVAGDRWPAIKRDIMDEPSL